MKNLTTTVFKVNGQFDIFASKETKRTQRFSELAKDMGKDWAAMSKRSRANFRKRKQGQCSRIETKIEVFNVSANIPEIFSEHQLKEAVILHLIHPATGELFLKCKNGKSGYSTSNFTIN